MEGGNCSFSSLDAGNGFVSKVGWTRRVWHEQHEVLDLKFEVCLSSREATRLGPQEPVGV